MLQVLSSCAELDPLPQQICKGLGQSGYVAQHDVVREGEGVQVLVENGFAADKADSLHVQ